MGRWGERRGVARRSGSEGEEELEVEVGWTLSLSLSFSWSLGCQPLLLWTWGRLFIIRSHNRLIIHQLIN